MKKKTQKKAQERSRSYLVSRKTVDIHIYIHQVNPVTIPAIGQGWQPGPGTGQTCLCGTNGTCPMHHRGNIQGSLTR